MATTLSSSRGNVTNVVVSYTEIAALLRNRLNDTELDAILSQLVASRRRQIQPGELITAEWATDLVNRVAALEGVDEVVSDAFNAKLLQTLLDAWSTFEGLERRGTFLPTGSDNAAMIATQSIGSAIRAVSARAAFAASQIRGANETLLLDLLTRLYRSERELAVFLASSIPGAADAGQRRVFASALIALLDTSSTQGASMKASLAQGDIEGVRTMQDRINGLVLNQSGEVTVGNIEVGFFKSSRGNNLLLNDTGTFDYTARVTNRTNRSLTVQLEARFEEDARREWNSFVGILGGSGTVTLESYDAANPNLERSSAEVTVQVRVPSMATKGQTGRLLLRAFVPQPVNLGRSDALTLTVDDKIAPNEPSVVKFTRSPTVVSGNLGAAKPDDLIELNFEFKFTTSEAQKKRSFVFVVDGNKELGGIDLGVPDPPGMDIANSTALRKLSKPFEMNDQDARNLTVYIVPTRPQQVLELSVSVREVSGSFETTVKQPLKLTVIQ